MSELVFSSGGEVLFRAPLNARSLRLGHSPLNDLMLQFDAVADFQASIEHTPEGHVLVDRSGSGTLVNGQSTQRAVLQPGDTITLGKLTAAYETQATGSPTRTTRQDRTDTGVDATFLQGEDRRRWPVTELGLKLGRDESNDVTLPDASVSSFHALVFRRGGATVVRDLGSTNGTFINAIRITEAEAPAGAALTLGGVVLTVVGAEGAAARERGLQRVGELFYVDAAMAQVAAAIRSVAPHDAPVAVTGESGCGKELVARAIHALGPRAAEPFVAVNCAALSPNLVESELFGHEKGAFTGADRARMGAFEEAGGGTLFLDEVGDLPTEAQAKMLRALENREIRRVGGDSVRKVHCRVITATHQNLSAKVKDGGFRNDLFHRLAALPIRIPPLRERHADIPLLAEHFLTQLGDGTTVLSPGAKEKLTLHAWPGNVRELRNVLLQAVVFSHKPVLEAADIKFPPVALADRMAEARIYLPGRTMADIEMEAIEQAVELHGSQSAAARELGIARSTIINRLNQKKKASR